MLRTTLRAPAQSICVLALTLLAAGCGGSSTGPAGGNAAFSATIDGVAWAAVATSTAANGAANGIFSIIGADATGKALSLTLYNIGAPGTYPLGVTGTVYGGTGIVTEASSSWSTPLSGAAGTVTITTVSGTRLVGTFSFTAAPLLGPGSTRSVTNGSFDVAVSSTVSVAVAANAGGKFGGTLGGQPWNAAVSVMTSPPSSGSLAAGFSNTTHQVTLILSGFTGVDTYGMSTGVARYFAVTDIATAKTWGGSGTTNTGSVVITSVTAARLAGTYDVTLQPGVASPGTGTLQMTGTFDVGLP
jgi:hypothetical protein